TGEVNERFSRKEKGEIERVVPTAALEFKVSLVAGGGDLRSPIEVAGASPFTLGLNGGGIALSAPPGSPPRTLWPLGGDDALGAANVLVAGDKGFALTFRREKAIWAGWLGADLKPAGGVVKVTGSGG